MEIRSKKEYGNMCDVYDEDVLVDIERKGEKMRVPFCNLKEGDRVVHDGHDFIVDCDAYPSEDVHYEGWVVHDTKGNGYFPEDFDAEAVIVYK